MISYGNKMILYEVQLYKLFDLHSFTKLIQINVTKKFKNLWNKIKINKNQKF